MCFGKVTNSPPHRLYLVKDGWCSCKKYEANIENYKRQKNLPKMTNRRMAHTKYPCMAKKNYDKHCWETVHFDRVQKYSTSPQVIKSTFVSVKTNATWNKCVHIINDYIVLSGTFPWQENTEKFPSSSTSFHFSFVCPQSQKFSECRN